MLTDDDLIALWTGEESDRVEFKQSAANDDLRKYICAFANDLPGHGKPGVIFVGLHRDRSCANLVVTDDVMNRLSNLRTDGAILPLPTLRVGRRSLRGCDMVVIEVEPADQPPVTCQGAIWVRTGTSLHRASADEERQLIERRRFHQRTFDSRPVPHASLRDLDLTLFERVYLPAALAPEVLAENGRPVEHRLAALRFLDPSGCPTYGGLLSIGKYPRGFVPGAYVQFLRLEGDELVSPIRNQLEIDGPLPDVLQRVDDILRAHISTGSDVTSGPREIRQPDYPVVALQQLAYNAILHRNYETSNAPVRLYWFSDRIEILNPGGLYGAVNPDNFGIATDYRNPVLAETIKTLGYIQRFGLGVALARAHLEKNGNPPPEFRFEREFVQATIRRRS
jgi:ATP-dependent DNA helicase RecG